MAMLRIFHVNEMLQRGSYLWCNVTIAFPFARKWINICFRKCWTYHLREKTELRIYEYNWHLHCYLITYIIFLLDSSNYFGSY